MNNSSKGNAAHGRFENVRDADATQRWIFLITHLSPGGTWEVLQILRREFRARGIEVSVVAFYRGGDPDPVEGADTVLLDGTRIGPLGVLLALLRLLHLMLTHRPAAVLTFMPLANVLGAIVALLAGIPRRYCTQHQPADTLNRWLRMPDRALGRLGGYSRILTVSHSIEASFEDHPAGYRDRMRVIPNAIAAIVPEASPGQVRQRLGVGEGEILAVAIGRLSWEKNALRTAIAAAQVPGLRLVLVGDGPQRPEIEAYVAATSLGQQVKLTGHRTRQEAIDILFAADVFVQLSFFEGRSLALLEALCAGKAIVASDIPAQREVLTLPDGRVAGLLCDPEDVDAIAETLRRVVADDGLRHGLVVRALDAAGMQDPGRMAEAYIGLAA